MIMRVVQTQTSGSAVYLLSVLIFPRKGGGMGVGFPLLVLSAEACEDGSPSAVVRLA